MSDKDELIAFQREGLADAITTWDHRVVITTSKDNATTVTSVTLRGVQTDVEVSPEELTRGGFEVKRVFALRVAGPDTLALVKVGMRGTDENGEMCRVLNYRRDRLGVVYIFGSVNQ